MEALSDLLHEKLHPAGGAAISLKFLQQFFMPGHRDRNLPQLSKQPESHIRCGALGEFALDGRDARRSTGRAVIPLSYLIVTSFSTNSE